MMRTAVHKAVPDRTDAEERDFLRTFRADLHQIVVEEQFAETGIAPQYIPRDAPKVQDNLKDKIRELYEKLRPGKYRQLPSLFSKYKGREAELLDKLQKKYDKRAAALTSLAPGGMFVDVPIENIPPSHNYETHEIQKAGIAGTATKLFSSKLQVSTAAVATVCFMAGVEMKRSKLAHSFLVWKCVATHQSQVLRKLALQQTIRPMRRAWATWVRRSSVEMQQQQDTLLVAYSTVIKHASALLLVQVLSRVHAGRLHNGLRRWHAVITQSRASEVRCAKLGKLNRLVWAKVLGGTVRRWQRWVHNSMRMEVKSAKATAAIAVKNSAAAVTKTAAAAENLAAMKKEMEHAMTRAIQEKETEHTRALARLEEGHAAAMQAKYIAHRTNMAAATESWAAVKARAISSALAAQDERHGRELKAVMGNSGALQVASSALQSALVAKESEHNAAIKAQEHTLATTLEAKAKEYDGTIASLVESVDTYAALLQHSSVLLLVQVLSRVHAGRLHNGLRRWHAVITQSRASVVRCAKLGKLNRLVWAKVLGGTVRRWQRWVRDDCTRETLSQALQAGAKEASDASIALHTAIAMTVAVRAAVAAAAAAAVAVATSMASANEAAQASRFENKCSAMEEAARARVLRRLVVIDAQRKFLKCWRRWLSQTMRVATVYRNRKWLAAFLARGSGRTRRWALHRSWRQWRLSEQEARNSASEIMSVEEAEGASELVRVEASDPILGWILKGNTTEYMLLRAVLEGKVLVLCEQIPLHSLHSLQLSAHASFSRCGWIQQHEEQIQQHEQQQTQIAGTSSVEAAVGGNARTLVTSNSIVCYVQPPSHQAPKGVSSINTVYPSCAEVHQFAERLQAASDLAYLQKKVHPLWTSAAGSQAQSSPTVPPLPSPVLQRVSPQPSPTPVQAHTLEHWTPTTPLVSTHHSPPTFPRDPSFGASSGVSPLCFSLSATSSTFTSPSSVTFATAPLFPSSPYSPPSSLACGYVSPPTAETQLCGSLSSSASPVPSVAALAVPPTIPQTPIGGIEFVWYFLARVQARMDLRRALLCWVHHINAHKALYTVRGRVHGLVSHMCSLLQQERLEGLLGAGFSRWQQVVAECAVAEKMAVMEAELVLHEKLRSPAHGRIHQRIIERQQRQQRILLSPKQRQQLSPLNPPLQAPLQVEEGSVWVEVIGQVSTRRVRCQVTSPKLPSSLPLPKVAAGQEVSNDSNGNSDNAAGIRNRLGQPLRLLSRALFGRSGADGIAPPCST
jgi:hypothetical protein